MESTTGIAAESITNVCRNGNVSETVVAAVAEATGVDPLDLDPLYDVVDPDALNALFDSAGTSPPAHLELSFTMADCAVVVRGDGEVVVTPPSEATDGAITVTRLDD